MRAHRHLKYLPASIASLVLATGAARPGAQSIYLAQKQEQFSAPRVEYFKTDIELDDISSSSLAGGSTQTQRIYVAPVVGIGWDSFIYHPDLLTFSVLAEPGYNWQQYNYGGTTSSQNSVLVNGNFTATILQMKPYATTVNYSRSHDEYQYDFFNSSIVDQEIFGATTGWREGAVPFTVSYQHTTRDSSGLSLNSTTDSTTVSLHASNTRLHGDNTVLDYQFTGYDSSSTDAQQKFTDSSETHYLAIADVEHFGKATLGSSLTWNHQENVGAPADDVNAMLDFGMEHNAHLRSFASYSVDHYTTEGTESLNQLLRAGLAHQLYESLTTTFDVHGTLANNNSFGSTVDQQSVGAAIALNYSKHLGAWGTLTVGENLALDQTHQDSSGSELFINNESHTVPLTGLFFLNTPREISVVSIKDSTGTITLVPGLGGDYLINTTTDPWQIQIFTTGPNHIAVGQNVQVSYLVQPNPTGDYSTLGEQFQVRLSFWHDRADLYARYNSTENQASSAAFVLENISEFQAGADVTWHGLRADATYTDRQSSLYDYQSFALSEGYSLKTGLHSTAGMDLRQQWSEYPGGSGTNSSQNVTYYSFTSRFEWHPLAGLSWNNEAGYEEQRGAGADQDLIVLRSYLNWLIGKLDFRLGYEFQNQQYTLEKNQRNFVYVRLRRNF